MSMTMREAVDRVNEDWVYQTDGAIDRWGWTTPGDCENYSLRVLMFIKGGRGAATRALASGDAHIWFVHTKTGAGHAVLEYRGRFVDNRRKEWVDDLEDLNLAPGGRRYTRIELLNKLGWGKLFSFFD
jgi:predicted transglutaminase-like cysteine proteinase